jgi:biotin operon repressor
MEVESTATAETIIKNPTYEEPSTIRESVDEYSSAAVYNAVKPLIVEALVKPQSLEELAEALHVRKTQLEDWIDQLQKEGIVEIRVIRKSKKLALRQSTGDLGI